MTTTDTLTPPMVVTVEAIVREAWLRLLAENATELAVPLPATVLAPPATCTATLRRPEAIPSDSRRSPVHRRAQRVWPTQRSPPPAPPANSATLPTRR